MYQMARDSLVAINIIQNTDNKNILLQENTTPILFYWDGEGTIKDSLVKDKFFVNKIIESCVNSDKYTSSSISYFYFKYDESDFEEYQDANYAIQDLFSLEFLDHVYHYDYSIIAKSYLYKIFQSLYKQSMKMDFETDDDFLFDNAQSIKQMYDDIQNKYKQKFIKESCLNYVRSELMKVYKLNNKNSDTIIEFLNSCIINNG